MTRRLAEIAAALAVLLVLYVSSASSPRGAWDDLAVLRAGAWLGTCEPADPLPTRLQGHLQKHSAGLSNIQRMRYQLRTEFSSNYGLIAPLVRELERAGRTPLLANVTLACQVQHLLIVLAVFALGWPRRAWLFLALLAAALPLAHAWPGDLASWLPFQRQSMSWAASAPRGAAVLAWFGAVTAWLTLSGVRRPWVALGFALASLLCHRSMAILCFAATVPTLGLWTVLRQRVRWRPTPALWLLAFCTLALLASAGKIGLLWYHERHLPTLFTLSGSGGSAEVRRAGWLLAAWAGMIVATLALWLHSRVRISSDPAGDSLRSTGDAIALLLGAAGAVCLGLNAAHPTSELWYRALFFVAEASMRLGSVPHLLFFALLAIIAVARWPRALTAALLGGAVLASVLAIGQLQRLKPPRLPEPTQSLAPLLRRGAKAYENEVQYYLSVASEVAEHGCGERQ